MSEYRATSSRIARATSSESAPREAHQQFADHFANELKPLVDEEKTVETRKYIEAARTIRRSITSGASIDQIINRYHQDEYVRKLGKAAIVFEILKAEKGSWLDKDSAGNVQWGSLRNTWYAPFGRILTSNVRKGSKGAIFDNLTIICFNYDRCLDQFLIHRLMDDYSLEQQEANSILDNFAKSRLHRPYGTLGDIDKCPDGCDYKDAPISEIAKEIRTLTEESQNAELDQGTRNAVAQAQTIWCLGFGFLDENMKLLHPHQQTGQQTFKQPATGSQIPT